MIEFKQGNIFDSSCQALVNPINCTPAMGKGLALQFRQKIPGLYDAHQVAAKGGLIQPGRITLFYCASRQQTIVGLPTKRDWRMPSRLEDVEAGLRAINEFLTDSSSIMSIAIPPLGCGLGGLAWNLVKDRIIQILTLHEGKRIEVYEPNIG